MSGGPWVVVRRQGAELVFLAEQQWTNKLPEAIVLASHEVACELGRIVAVAQQGVMVWSVDEARLELPRATLRQLAADQLEDKAGELAELLRWCREANVLDRPPSLELGTLERVVSELSGLAAEVRRG